MTQQRTWNINVNIERERERERADSYFKEHKFNNLLQLRILSSSLLGSWFAAKISLYLLRINFSNIHLILYMHTGDCSGLVIILGF